jgi:hypothetical protein
MIKNIVALFRKYGKIKIRVVSVTGTSPALGNFLDNEYFSKKPLGAVRTRTEGIV